MSGENNQTNVNVVPASDLPAGFQNSPVTNQTNTNVVPASDLPEGFQNAPVNNQQAQTPTQPTNPMEIAPIAGAAAGAGLGSGKFGIKAVWNAAQHKPMVTPEPAPTFNPIQKPEPLQFNPQEIPNFTPRFSADQTDAVKNWQATQGGPNVGGANYGQSSAQSKEAMSHEAAWPERTVVPGSRLSLDRETVKRETAEHEAKIAQQRAEIEYNNRIGQDETDRFNRNFDAKIDALNNKKRAAFETAVRKEAIPAALGSAVYHPAAAPIRGAIAGVNAVNAINQAYRGDPTAVLSTVGAAAPLIAEHFHPKTLPGKWGKVAAGAVGLAAPVISAIEGHAEGGSINMAGGGKVDLFFQGLKAAKNIAEGFTPKETQIVRASEALAPHEGKYLNVTQSDRMRSTEGDLGGPGFSRFQTIDPKYAEAQAAWGVGKKPTASAIVNVNKRFPEGQAIWSPMIGSESQHHSNQHVFDALSDEFNRQSSMGKLTPELRDRINQRLQTAPAYKGRFDPTFDISDPEMLSEAGKTFDRRGALSEVMSGQGVGGAKGSIIDYPGIMQEMTDPMTIGAPTHSIGTRLFSLSGDVDYRPDLHSAFPYILKGEDQGVAFNPVPKELALSDWIQNFKDFKGRSPGYYDMTRTVPSQFISEDYLRNLEDAGHAEGGTIKMADGGKLKSGLSMLPMSARTELRERGQLANTQGIPAALAMRDPAMAAAYNSMPVQAGIGAATFLNPTMMGADIGKNVLQNVSEGNYGGAAVDAGIGALPYAGKSIGAIRAALGHVPAMASGGDVLRALSKLSDVAEGVGSRAIEGSPHSYPPIAEGPWMRDYQQAAEQVPAPTPDAAPGSRVVYMGKYRQITPEIRAAQKAAEDSALNSVIGARKAQYIDGLKNSGWSDQEIAEHVEGPHPFGPPWLPR